ncbi:hypothetical protein HHX47_DHR1000041 [Lentinula edodes]|nr:hypothetical protein HHX47_DHR1000041 [Lentinula edodes]
MSVPLGQHPSFHLRPATLSDVSKIMSLVLPQVSHDGFHDYFFPYQDRYPQDFDSWWRRYYRDMILRPYTLVLVAEDSDRDMKGIAVWVYAPKVAGGGSGDNDDVPEPKGLNIAKNSWYYVIRRHTYAWMDKIADKIQPNRCIDRNAIQEWRKTVADMSKRLWSGEDRVHWYSFEFFTFGRSANGEEEKRTESHLISHGDDQDKGDLASLLLGWGIRQSKVDHVSTFVLTLISLRELYEGVGYKVVDEVQCGPSRCIAMKFIE